MTEALVLGSKTQSKPTEKSEKREMGKQPVRMKAVIYALSPFQQKVMTGLWKDAIGKLSHKVEENWLNAVLLVGPVAGTYMYVQNYKEKEKMEHRY